MDLIQKLFEEYITTCNKSVKSEANDALYREFINPMAEKDIKLSLRLEDLATENNLDYQEDGFRAGFKIAVQFLTDCLKFGQGGGWIDGYSVFHRNQRLRYHA